MGLMNLLSGWRGIRERDVPSWIMRAALKKIRIQKDPSNLVLFFKGKEFTYKIVCFGKNKIRYYRK